jgi:hypothetical protein
MIEIKIIHEIQDVRQPQQADLLEQLLPFMEKIVSQLEDLQAAGEGVKADLAIIKDHLASQSDKLAALAAQLEQLNQTTPPQVDLSAAVALAQEIKGEADAIVASFGPQDPPVGGDPTGSGDAGGTPAGGDQVPAGDTGSSAPVDSTGGDQPADQQPPVDDGSAGTGDVSGPGPDQGSTDQSGADPAP